MAPARCFAAEIPQHNDFPGKAGRRSAIIPSACPMTVFSAHCSWCDTPPIVCRLAARPVEARNSVGRLVCSGIELTMAHFLLIPKDVQCPPAGFSLLEKFTCPNCGREVFIASTTHAEECRTEQIVKARNAVTLNCPVHGVPACVEVPAEGRRLRS